MTVLFQLHICNALKFCHFQDAICTSLQEYNQHIDSLKDEMDEATNSAREIRGEITAFRNKCVPSQFTPYLIKLFLHETVTFCAFGIM